MEPSLNLGDAVAKSHIDAGEAAARLKVSRATLYAYVSRGLVRAVAHPDDPRARLYAVADVEALIRRKTSERKPADAARGALDWGLPALDTAISSIADGELRYRGVEAVAFSRTATLETAAALLWQSDALADARFDAAMTPGWLATQTFLTGADPLSRALALVALMQADDVPGLAPERLLSRGGVLVRAIVAALAPGADPDLPVHAALARAWEAPAAAEIIRRTLVLLADHEMNASTFAVRVAASTGATLTASLIAGIAALSGPRHGGAVARVGALFDELSSDGAADERLRARMRRGDEIPGFGHPLYPDGDPRAKALLADLNDLEADRFVAAVESGTGQKASIDVALFALERAHRLPAGAGVSLFAAGRAVGWVAHVLEQMQTGRLIRPRSRFKGPGS